MNFRFPSPTWTLFPPLPLSFVLCPDCAILIQESCETRGILDDADSLNDRESAVSPDKIKMFPL